MNPFFPSHRKNTIMKTLNTICYLMQSVFDRIKYRDNTGQFSSSYAHTYRKRTQEHQKPGQPIQLALLLLENQCRNESKNSSYANKRDTSRRTFIRIFTRNNQVRISPCRVFITHNQVRLVKKQSILVPPHNWVPTTQKLT